MIESILNALSSSGPPPTKRMAVIGPDGVIQSVITWTEDSDWPVPEGCRLVEDLSMRAAPGLTIPDDELLTTRPEPEPGIERRMVPKSVVIARLTDAQLASAKAIFNQQPRLEARWYTDSIEHPGKVYADDPDALALLKAIGADPDVVMAE